MERLHVAKRFAMAVESEKPNLLIGSLSELVSVVLGFPSSRAHRFVKCCFSRVISCADQSRTSVTSIHASM